MVAIAVYDASGAKTREVELDPKALDKAVRKPLLKEALIAYLASQRQGSHSTKTRAEIQGGRQKPWRQKGTGRARQGTIRAPQFVGGGRAHGPKPRDYAYRLPKKQRRQALRSALRFKLESGLLCAVDGLDGQEQPKTKRVVQFLRAAGLDGQSAMFVSESSDQNLVRSARNLQRVDVAQRTELNAGHVMQRHHLVLTASALDALVQEVSA